MKKGDTVCLISTGGNGKIFIKEDLVVAIGKQNIRFEGWGQFPLDAVVCDVSDIPGRGVLGTCIATDQAFIDAFIKDAKVRRKRGLEKAKANLEKEPNSRRFKSHLALHTNPVSVVDLRVKCA